MLNTIVNEYTNCLTSFTTQLQVIEKKIKLISIIRLLTAIGIILCFYFALTYLLSLFYLFFSIILFFVVMVLMHSHYFKKKQILLNYIQINNEELDALKGNYTCFDEGKEFIDHSHGY